MIEPIRVLHVIGIMNRGGAETMIMNLYRNIDRSKVQFDFIENSNEPAAFDSEICSLGGKIYRCPHYNGKNYFAYIKWWKTFFHKHHEEYRIVHGHIGSTASIYLKIAKENGLYTIAHSHSSGTDHSLKSILYKVLSYNTRNIADYFFACSEAAGRDRYGRKVVSGRNYCILNNAIDTNRFVFNPTTREDVRKEFGYTQEHFVVGHIGRYTSEKNHAFLLQVFAELLKRNDNARFLMVGDGPLHPQIVQMSEKIGISQYIIFTGVRSDVNRLLQGMDVFTLPSIFEGLPVTLVEAQTSGIPCVISDGVPLDSIITKDLVTVQKLSDSAQVWAEHILSRAGVQRTDRRFEIIKNGFDIRETSKWLEEFYLEKISQ